MNQWKSHNALAFFKLITVPQSTHKTSGVTFGTCEVCLKSLIHKRENYKPERQVNINLKKPNYHP